MYLGQIEKIEARKSVAALEAASYPYMKKNDRRKVDRKYERIFERDVEPSPKMAEASWAFLRKKYRQLRAAKHRREGN